MSRPSGGGSLLAAAPRRTATVVIAAVVLIGTAFGGGAVWIMSHSSSGAPPTAWVPGLGFGRVQPITANGAGNGPGGCRGPGPGLTEYCYEFQFVDCCSGLAGTLYGSSVTPPTTADIKFGVLLPDGRNASYQNFTLLDASDVLLAEYTAAGGWNAHGATELPLTIQTPSDSVILNFGTTDASGDTLIVYNVGSTLGGESSSPLP